MTTCTTLTGAVEACADEPNSCEALLFQDLGGLGSPVSAVVERLGGGLGGDLDGG